MTLLYGYESIKDEPSVTSEMLLKRVDVVFAHNNLLFTFLVTIEINLFITRYIPVGCMKMDIVTVKMTPHKRQVELPGLSPILFCNCYPSLASTNTKPQLSNSVGQYVTEALLFSQ